MPLVQPQTPPGAQVVIMLLPRPMAAKPSQVQQPAAQLIQLAPTAPAPALGAQGNIG